MAPPSLTRPPRIALYGLFGIGNIGNEASLDSVIEFLRARAPQAQLTVVCTEPAAVTARTGLPAVAMAHRASAPRGPRWSRAFSAMALRLSDVPRTFRFLRGQDAVIVPGMGVLEERLGARPWGLPWNLLLLGVAAAILRIPLSLISIGADNPQNRLTRLAFAVVARRASYRSYRDPFSQQAVAALGIRGDVGPVYPDLAFSLPIPASASTAARAAVSSPEPFTVAFGVLAWYGAADDRRAGAQVHLDYVTHLARLVIAIADDGHRVRFVVGDAVDAPVAESIRRRILETRPDLAEAVAAGIPATTFDELLDQLAPSALVVASRYHNLVAALMLSKPVVSLGYGPKNDELLADFALGEFGQQLDEFDPAQALQQIRLALADAKRLSALTAARLADVRALLAEQFERLPVY